MHMCRKSIRTTSVIDEVTDCRPIDHIPELTVVLPCLNEARTVGKCVRQALEAMHSHSIEGEVVVVDNGSTDESHEVARNAGARIVEVGKRGYGAAIQGGIWAARGRYIILGDADLSYDFGDIPVFLGRLRSGDDLVIGNRFLGGIRPGAMPFLHRYVGNPLLTGIGRLLFGSPCRDFHCGMRGCRTDSIRSLELSSTGMEFASEMIVKATVNGLRISEVPTTLSPDGRGRPSHLRTFRDGWRHLRLLLSSFFLSRFGGGTNSAVGIAVQEEFRSGR